ncbi:MAG: TPM domain-containing protein [Lachnospiraceae bacterium]|nr:TPM domain-containing protein [Lachnospiraceae bacterium]
MQGKKLSWMIGMVVLGAVLFDSIGLVMASERIAASLPGMSSPELRQMVEEEDPDAQIDLRYVSKTSGKILIVQDEEDLFSDNEVRQFIESAADVMRFANVCILTCRQPNYEGYVGQMNDRLFGDGTDSTTFMINMDPRVIYIYSEGQTKRILTAAKARSITDNIYRHASMGAYYECTAKALMQEARLLNGKGIWEPMKYIGDFFLAFTIAILFVFTLTFVLMPQGKRKAVASISEAALAAMLSAMVLEQTYHNRVYDPPSSDDSSSSGGGGGGGGGGDSGAGGGHSF